MSDAFARAYAEDEIPSREDFARRRKETAARYRARNKEKILETERIRKLKQRERRKQWTSSSPEKRKEYYTRYHSKERTALVEMEQRLRMKFGIGVDDYNAMLENQGYGCAICKTPFGGVHMRSPDKEKHKEHRLVVDHCHETGRIRGLLCRKCNTAIGLFSDDADLLGNAIDYLSGRDNDNGI